MTCQTEWQGDHRPPPTEIPPALLHSMLVEGLSPGRVKMRELPITQGDI